MDLSARKNHLAGSLANALLAHYLHKNWLRANIESRALSITKLGERVLSPLLAARGMNIDLKAG